MLRVIIRTFATMTVLVFVIATSTAVRAEQEKATGSAGAQSQGTDDATTPDSNAPTFRATTEVTATAVAEERRDVPATVRVIDGAEIAARHDESVLDLLATVSGAQAATYGPPGQLGSLFVRGADSNQTLVLWNGVPLNDPFSDEYNFAFLATDAVTRV